MISVNVEKNRKTGKWRMAAVDGPVDNPHRVIAHGGGNSPREAAEWLVRQVNRIVVETEQALIDLGFLTEAEIEQVLESTEEKTNGEGKTAE